MEHFSQVSVCVSVQGVQCKWQRIERFFWHIDVQRSATLNSGEVVDAFQRSATLLTRDVDTVIQ